MALADALRSHRSKKKRNPGDGGVSKKIGHLVREGKPQKQAVAIALSMKRAGRLGPKGQYRHVGTRR
ncbi:MAG: hypothetical protein ACRDZ4_10925 [Egibacteraceae bacterium]